MSHRDDEKPEIADPCRLYTPWPRMTEGARRWTDLTGYRWFWDGARMWCAEPGEREVACDFHLATVPDWITPDALLAAVRKGPVSYPGFSEVTKHAVLVDEGERDKPMHRPGHRYWASETGYRFVYLPDGAVFYCGAEWGVIDYPQGHTNVRDPDKFPAVAGILDGTLGLRAVFDRAHQHPHLDPKPGYRYFTDDTGRQWYEKYPSGTVFTRAVPYGRWRPTNTVTLDPTVAHCKKYPHVYPNFREVFPPSTDKASEPAAKVIAPGIKPEDVPPSLKDIAAAYTNSGVAPPVLTDAPLTEYAKADAEMSERLRQQRDHGRFSAAMQDVIASLQSCVDNLAFACGTPQIGYRSQTAEIEQLRLELTNANLIQMTLQGNLSAATLKLKEAREEIENLQKQVEKLQRGVAAKAPPQGQ